MKAKYRKPPTISPGLVYFRKRFLMGLYKGGLIYGGGGYTWTIFCVSNNKSYFSPCLVSFVLIGEYIQYSPLINFCLVIPSNIHLQCLCSTKNQKKPTSRRQYGIENYFYSDSLTRPRNVKNKYVILRHLGDMCLFTSVLRALVNKSHIPLLPQNNLYIHINKSVINRKINMY